MRALTESAHSFAPAGEAAPKANPAADELTRLVLEKLDDDKAEDVVVIDLKEKSSVADAMIIANGRSQRHVGAIADHLLRGLKDAGHGGARVEGMPACDWVLIDAGDVIVHLFRPEVRAYYNLEKMWGGKSYVAQASSGGFEAEADATPRRGGVFEDD